MTHLSTKSLGCHSIFFAIFFKYLCTSIKSLTMKKLLTLFLALTAIFTASAQSGRVLTFSDPDVKIFLPPSGTANGKAIVCCPGGGYSIVAAQHEGYDWAPYFNNLGVALAVVNYRLPGGNREIPMADVRAAYKLLSDSAAVWGINPDAIGVMGSSAGGHLASAVATHPTPDCKPAFQLLFYPVASLDAEITHKGTRNGFLGKDNTDANAALWSAENNINPQSPRTMLIHCSDDNVVHPQNSIRLYSALQRAGVPVTMLMYPTGSHGWGFHRDFKYHDVLLDEIDAWLTSF